MPPACRSLAALALCAAVACRVGPHDAGGLSATPVLRVPTLVAFTLPASDTLEAGEEQASLEEFRAYTAMVMPYLADLDVQFQATTADSIIIERSDGVRRVVMLGGLDYPYGYVLVDPGFPETILTGVLTDSELEDELDWYFGDDDESDQGETPRHLSLGAGGAMQRMEGWEGQREARLPQVAGRASARPSAAAPPAP